MNAKRTVALWIVMSCGLVRSPTRHRSRRNPPSWRLHPRADGTFTFDTGVLQGRVHSDGRGFGLNGVTHAASGQAMSGAVGWLGVYRVFSDGQRYGNAGWEWPNKAELNADGSVTVRCDAEPTRPFALEGRYRWRSPACIDFELRVTPAKDLHGFEVFVSSYFDKAFTNSAAYVNENPQAGGKPGFMSAKQELGNWLMFPRDAAAASRIQDGRWQLPPNPVEWTIMPAMWMPLAMRRIPDSRLTVLLMASPQDAFAIAMPYETEGHYSVYLSLFGRDLTAGESARARVRLQVLAAPDDATIAQAYAEFDDTPKK